VTPRLTRVPTLHSFRRALIDLIPLGDIDAARATAVIVPTRSAAALLRRTIEDRLRPGDAVALPDIVTRRDLYPRLIERLETPPPMLGPFDREVLMEAAAHQAITDGATPPFHLRSALIGEIVSLYDAIRRQRQTADDFERLVLEPLSAEAEAEGDAGAERLQRQTRFLAHAFRGYEERRTGVGRHDEHTVRELLLQATAGRPYRRIVVAVADEAREPGGLWSADYDLLARMPGLEALEFVATERMLASGLAERLHVVMPELDVERKDGEAEAVEGFDAPRLLVPAAAGGVLADTSGRPALCFKSRDREEELRDLARRIRLLAREADTPISFSRIVVVFERPLPYVYLAREIFGRAGLPVDVRDALPLAAEPYAAAVDLVLSCAATRFSRAGLVALLASPHFTFAADAVVLERLDVAALDQALEEHEHGGDADRLEALAAGWLDGTQRSQYARWDAARAARAARAAAAVIRELSPFENDAPASVQLGRLTGFLVSHAAPIDHDDPLRERLLRAREAVGLLLGSLAESHRIHHDLLWTLAELTAEVRLRLEGETFTPSGEEGGIQLVDASAAAFGDAESRHLVGLVDGEWPRRARRNIFYSAGLLATLGWPGERADALAPARASFLDLLQDARRHVSVSTFALEDDALVEPSPLVDDIGRAALTAVALDVPEAVVFDDEALLTRPVTEEGLTGGATSWARVRALRLSRDLSRFHGETGPQAPRARSVSALDLYAQCPFKYYSRHVLRLAEERDDEDGLTPLERGRLHHEIFEAIFAAWRDRGHGAVTPEKLDEARALAVEAMEMRLTRLSAVDAALERTRLIGSPVAPGLIDVVLRLEAERPVAVVERRLEHRVDGLYTFRGPGGARQVEVRGIADRIDLLADGTFRVFDYKASAPASTLQIAVYAICATQRLRGYRGRDWTLAEAAYVAFRGDRTVVPLAKPGEVEAALLEAEAEVVRLTEAIEGGRFPPRPRSRSLCATCAFAAVCRKDYVDVHDAAPAV
jgi:RecB family exonuclease